MFSFSKLFTVGVLAISAFAAPRRNAPYVGDVDVRGLDAKVGPVAHPRDIAEVEAGPGTDFQGLDYHAIGVDSELRPIVDDMTALIGTGKTVDELSTAVAPMTIKVVTILNGAVSEVQSLSGLPMDQILASNDGGATLAVRDVTKLLADVLSLVLGVVGTLLGGVQGGLSPGSLLAALEPMVYRLAFLLQAVQGLVGGVLGNVIAAVALNVAPLLSIIPNALQAALFA